MAYDPPGPGSLKRKRRRADKPAVSARFYLDATLKGEVGVLSEDLIQTLFPQGVPAPDANGYQQEIYVAVSLWTPNPVVAESSWIILPINPSRSWNDKTLQNSTIRLPASSLSTQSFVNLVQALTPNRTLRQNSSIEVRVSDVVPLVLDTVYVSVDAEALQKLDEISRKYGGGYTNTNGSLGRKLGRKIAQEELEAAEKDAEDKRKKLVEDALSNLSIIHTGDMLPLALSHPVTHNPAPPAKILGCEPVAQGLLGPSTKIVITSSAERYQPGAGNRALLSPRLPEETEEEDTANEAYFSANDSPMRPVVTSKSATDLSNSEIDSAAEDSNLSDDDDDLISLAKPGIMDAPTGLSSAMTAATPRPFGSRLEGIATPGSVFSHISSSTVRGGQAAGRSRVFRAQPLIRPISEVQLYPKPGSDDDEETRIYVDATTLAKLGCFSGDWVKIEASQSHQLPQLSAFAGLDGVMDQEWRPVRVYGLPETLSKRQTRFQTNVRGGRRDSISSFMPAAASAMTLYISPILLANLDNPSHVSVSMLPIKRVGQKRSVGGAPTSTSTQAPPVASEVTLRKVVTPLSTERALNAMLFTNLKEYLERKQRIVKDGDLIAFPVDAGLARSLYEGEIDTDEGVSAMYKWSAANSADAAASSVSVAWFTVESIKTPSGSDDESPETFEFWGGAASIDPSATAVRQSGDDKRRLPSATVNTWPYYLGVWKANTKTGAGIPEAPQPYVSPLQRRLRELLSVAISPRAIHLGLPPIAVLLTSAHRGIGKAYTAERVCIDLGVHFFAIDAFDMASEGGSGVDVQSQGLFEARCARALECGGEFTAICIRHLEQLASDRIATSIKDVLGKGRVVIATTTDLDKIPDTIRSLFTHELDMGAPDEGEREGILRDVLAQTGVPLASEVEVSNIAVKTAALVAGDLTDVVERAVVARAERLESLARSATQSVGQEVTLKDIALSGGAGATSITGPDFDAAVELARKNFADSVGAPKIPNVQWKDVGGLSHVKDAIIETIQLPLSRPELFAKGLKKRSGILFYGPPGTGKTLLAKAIATEFSLNFFSVKGPELLNMYIGESEANVRRVFQRARDARPCCVFFDELDSVAPKRGNQGDSGGVMDRIVSQLLAELDGMSDAEEGGGGVFVIGATNRPDLLDQALLRPGRFDKMLYLGISDTHDKQTTILQALTRKFTLDPSLSLSRVASNLPFTFTGADLYALCSDAMLKAITRSARLVDSRVAAINAERATRSQGKISIAYFFDHFAKDEDTQVAVIEDDFNQAKAELVPSVSMDELKHYEHVRDTFEGAAKKPNEDEKRVKTPVPVAPPAAAPEKPGTRAKMAEMARRLTKKATPVNGGDFIRDFAARPPAALHSDSDDDYVVRTDHMSLNGTRSPAKKGKGKGKDSISLPSTNGEDLYD
ncbi:hypothetical protein AMS68_002583 [Peltaster fructicola]|uniref:Peroxisomal ATPase PEX6 n=1 Tax=Peltaster fructicola TaxID=286661 RepID=A0A6H0XQU9_9PEZI|nr:hypothetical protein AMS68_002583 [Peltaster fructicola]